MRKKIIILSGIIIGIILIAGAFVGYFFYREFEELKKLNEPHKPKISAPIIQMTQERCQRSGGKWNEMKILKDEGYAYKYFCACHKTGSEETEVWINEGEVRRCP